MGHKNKYLDKVVPAMYRLNTLDTMIYTWINAQRFLIPSLSVENCALSFLMYHQIEEEELSLDKVKLTYYRIQKSIINERKTA